MSLSIKKNGIFDPEGKYPNPLTGQPYSKSYKVLALGNKSLGIKGWSEYSAWTSKLDIIKKIHQTQILLLVLPTGVGKTVIVPKLLLHYFDYKKRVVVTVPRLAVGAEAGTYAAKLLDVPLYAVDDIGKEIINPNAKDKEDNLYPTGNKIVGYKYSSIGNKFGDDNSILLFTTDGNIKQKIVSGDRDLSNYGGIIIDEAHERSINIDILIALVMDIIPRRPDFKVIIMSATIKKEIFTNYFKRIGLGNNYSTFSLDEVKTNFKIDFQPTLKNVTSNKIVDEVYKKINEIILDAKLPVGNVLAFVTSESEISKIEKKIALNMKNYALNNKPYTIGFTATITDKNKSIAVGNIGLNALPPTHNAPQGFSRKVIIATNAVESSITFKEPMVYVIDTGLAFEKKYDAKNYCNETGKNLVSQASIKQRCGRTGRNCNGFCIQLYTTDQYEKLSVYTTPKILVEDFTSDLLSLSIINGNVKNAFKFMDKMIEETSAYKDNISRAYHNLLNMDLIDSAGNVTNLGIVCSKFNDIKLAKMLIGGYYLGCMNWCMMLGAILKECESFDKMFKNIPNMDEDPKLKQQYDNNIKKFVNVNGDHITLLIIFNNYISIAEKDRYEYANNNGLEFRILNKIQQEYSNLVKTVTQQIPYIKNLNLFNVPPEQLIFGGGSKKNDGGNYDGGNYNDDNRDVDSDKEVKETNSDIESEDESDDDELDFEKDEAEFEDYIENLGNFGNLSNASNLYSLKGGLGKKNNKYHSDSKDDEDDSEDDEYDSEDDSDDDSEDDSEDEYNADNIELTGGMIDKINIEYNNYKDNKNSISSSTSSSTSINNNASRNGSNINNYQGSFQSTNSHYYSDTNQNNRNIKNSRRLTNKNINSNTNTERKKSKRNIILNGGNNSHEDDNKNKKRRKIMEFLNIKNLEHIKITPPSSIIDRILAALFFGYSNNIACYSGKSKSYHVKFSPKQGSIESTSFDFSKKIPDFIIYNDFSINKDMGSSGAKLSMVSEINTHHFGHFIDINELRKKLKD